MGRGVAKMVRKHGTKLFAILALIIIGTMILSLILAALVPSPP